MTRHLLIFAVTFAIGAVVAVVLRTASHQPYTAPPATMPAEPVAAAPAPIPATAVNTICPICGMPVNLALGTVSYKGKAIGLGCKACPPKFAAEPEKYGEAALKNQVVE